MRTIPYSFVVDSLMYAQVCTRLDIAFVVACWKYLSNLGSQHWKAAKKVLRRNCILEKCQVDTYNILNYEGRVCDMLSGLLSCYVDAEFISALGVVDSISRLLKLFCDNFVAVAFSKNTRSTFRSKHIDVKFYLLRRK
ncbi:hypothetical protein CK203_091367 [Vitis vinifera]|uniref:Retrovirus-related Pol polyprotein from transposon TNT 1-94 n=1 Tax=Vitis vinifera TaxID=29760 RepID=A0A438CLW9_VITVI|nr:hypothetical protein CK203_091367 [Vitis vinifera]